MELRMEMPAKWRPIAEGKANDIYLPCGRDSGKTNNTVRLATALSLTQEGDIVCTRASYGSLGDTLYAEFESGMEELGEEVKSCFEFRKSPLRIERKDGKGVIYFIGSGGSNKDRTKGLKTKHKVIAVIVDEAQEFKERESYDQFMISVRRHLGEGFKRITLGNPPAMEPHWFNRMIKEKEADSSCLVIRMTWRDIHWYLSDFDIKEIIKTYRIDPDFAKWMYDGIPTGGKGKVYPMFRKDVHLVPYDERGSSRLLSDFTVVGVVIGCDGAVNNDTTVMVPRLIFANGQSCAAKIFRHDPNVDGVLGSFPMVEREATRWFAELRKENGLDNPADYRYSIPIAFVVDSAATELIQALRYYFSNRAVVYPIKKGTIIQMVDTVQSAISKNVVGVYDYGGHYDYALNKWVKQDNQLAYQYASLIWNDQQTGYDPRIPNDWTDADTYAIYFYYGKQGPENIAWLADVARARKDYYNLKGQ